VPPPTPSFEGIQVAIVLPTLNEEAGIAKTLDGLHLGPLVADGWRVSPLVMDGGSTDRTVEIARARGVPVLVQHSKGKGGAIKEAFEWLRTQHVRYAILLDADCTYPGDAVGPVLALLAAGSHLVVGVRYPEQSPLLGVRDLIHRFGNAVLNFTGSWVGDHPVLDLCSGLYGLDLTQGLELDLRAEGFDIEAELFLKAYRGGFIVTQFPIVYRERVGEPKLRAVQDGTRIFSTILRRGRGRRHMPRHPVPGTSVLIRELLSTALVHEASRVVIYGPPSEEPIAVELMRRLRLCGIQEEFVLSRRANGSIAVHGTLPTIHPHDADASMYVALRPPASENHVRRARAVVVLPRTRRILFLGNGDPTLPSPPKQSVEPPAPLDRPASPLYFPEFVNNHRGFLGPVRALAASVDQTVLSKELALLGANGLRSSLSVWRRRMGGPYDGAEESRTVETFTGEAEWTGAPNRSSVASAVVTSH
jgi:hypothetical protein